MSNETIASGWLAFDNVDIDVTGHRLLVNGEEVALERKAFAVLVLLARAPGRVFSRDEILDAVWGHSHVTPGVLNRIVTVLRHALGEKADESRYLSTVHGVGYRFDAVLRAASPVEPAAGAVAAVDRGDDAGPASAAPLQSLSAAAPDPFGQTRQQRRFVLAGLLIMTALLGAGYWLTRSKPMPVSSTPVLVVLPLHPVGDTHDENILAEGLSEELITRLSRIDGLRLISITSAARAQSGKFDLPQLAEKLKVTHALEGSLREDGGELRTDLRLIEVPSGNTLWAQNYDRSIANVFALERDIADAVAVALALKLKPGQAAPVREEDPVLYRRYVEARRLGRGIGAPREEAIAAFHQLIADAPDYARARGGLALVLVHSPAGGLAEAKREAERALALDPMLADANAASGFAACSEDDWERGVMLSQRAVEQAPADSAIRAGYGVCLAMLGYLPAALAQVETARAADPLSYEVTLVHGLMLQTLGRHAEATRYLSAYPTGFIIWFNSVWTGHLALARTQIGDDSRFHDSYAAVLDALEDPAKWPAARIQVDASERSGVTAFNFVRVLDPQPDIARDIVGLEQGWHKGGTIFSLTLWQPELANHRRGAAFQDYLRRTHTIDYWRAHGWPVQCKPDGEGAKCD